jgi:hypothetical protein
MEYLISQLEIGSSYAPVPFPKAGIIVLDKTESSIKVLRFLPLPSKELNFDFNTFNTGKGGTGQQGCKFIKIN